MRVEQVRDRRLPAIQEVAAEAPPTAATRGMNGGEREKEKKNPDHSGFASIVVAARLR